MRHQNFKHVYSGTTVRSDSNLTVNIDVHLCCKV